MMSEKKIESHPTSKDEILFAISLYIRSSCKKYRSVLSVSQRVFIC